MSTSTNGGPAPVAQDTTPTTQKRSPHDLFNAFTHSLRDIGRLISDLDPRRSKEFVKGTRTVAVIVLGFLLVVKTNLLMLATGSLIDFIVELYYGEYYTDLIVIGVLACGVTYLLGRRLPIVLLVVPFFFPIEELLYELLPYRYTGVDMFIAMVIVAILIVMLSLTQKVDPEPRIVYPPMFLLSFTVYTGVDDTKVTKDGSLQDPTTVDPNADTVRFKVLTDDQIAQRPKVVPLSATDVGGLLHKGASHDPSTN